MAYSETRKDTLSASEKNGVKIYLERVKTWLNEI